MKKRIKHIVFMGFLVLPGVFFLINGYLWLVSPEAAASSMMMPLLSGSALNSQMSDIGGMFLGMGLIVLGSVVTRKGDWLLPVAIILSCIVIYRLLGFVLYAAGISPRMLSVEIILAIWFTVASQKMGKKELENES